MRLRWMHELDAADIKQAKTGRPIKVVGYRAQYKQEDDRARGIFYAAEESYADGYMGPGKHKRRVLLRFGNPFVCDRTTKALDYLLEQGLIDAALHEKISDYGAYAWPPGERIIASGMRRLGHDAIIYNGGLDEIVDLR